VAYSYCVTADVWHIKAHHSTAERIGNNGCAHIGNYSKTTVTKVLQFHWIFPFCVLIEGGLKGKFAQKIAHKLSTASLVQSTALLIIYFTLIYYICQHLMSNKTVDCDRAIWYNFSISATQAHNEVKIC